MRWLPAWVQLQRERPELRERQGEIMLECLHAPEDVVDCECAGVVIMTRRPLQTGLPARLDPNAPKKVVKLYKRRTETEAAECIRKCEGCRHERLYENDVPGCELVTACCGSRSPLGFRKYVLKGAPCPHEEGDRFAAAMNELNESEAAVKSD
jgi:hypothetical protein